LKISIHHKPLPRIPEIKKFFKLTSFTVVKEIFRTQALLKPPSSTAQALLKHCSSTAQALLKPPFKHCLKKIIAI